MTDAVHNALLCALQPLLGRAPRQGDLAIAWSGGADSTALLRAALRLGPSPHGSPLVALHVDHQLRPDSSADAAWCHDTAKAWGTHLHLMASPLPEGPQIAAHSGSIETLARQARYALMGRLLRDHDLAERLLLTAHHADDNLESLLLALGRGAGLIGVAGIRPCIALSALSAQSEDETITVARPLLKLTRTQLHSYLVGLGQDWREDPSNALPDRRRNQLRHQVIPALMATADQPQPIYRTLQSLRDDRALVERLSADALSALRVARPWYRAQGILVARRRLRAYDRLMQRHVIRAAFRAAGLRHMPDRSSILRVLEHLDHTGAIIEVHGAHVEIEPKRIAFVHRSTTPDLWPVPQAPVNLDQPGDRILWGTRVTVTARRVDGASEQDKAQWLERCRTLERGGPEGPQVAVADASEVAWPLTIRPPHPGERLHRLGGGHKTLAALMSDAGVPRLARPWIPVIHGRCGNVLWAPGVIRTRAATLSPQTVNLIVLSWTPDDADGEDGVF